jgi:hypothetical protein
MVRNAQFEKLQNAFSTKAGMNLFILQT